MEKYLAQTEGLLGVIQATISKEELKRSADAGEEMWGAIRKIVDTYQLNTQEMMNATLGVNLAILQVIVENINQVKHEKGE